MEKKMRILGTVGIILAALLICGTCAAAWWVAANAKSGQLGGLVGELLAGQENKPQLFPDQTQDGQTTEQELMTNDGGPPLYTPIFYIDATRIRDTLRAGTLHESGEYVSLTAEEACLYSGASLLPAGKSYTDVACLVIVHRTDAWEAQGSFCIGAREYSDSGWVNFTYFTRDDYAKPVWRSSIVEIDGLSTNSPHNDISDLSYMPFINEKDAQSLDVAFIAGFSSREDAEAYLDHQESPAFMGDAVHLAAMLESQPSKGLKSHKYHDGENYVTVRQQTDAQSMAFTVCPYTGELYSTGARYLVIKIQFSGSTCSGYVTVSSTTPEKAGTLPFRCVSDGWWSLIIIDLAEIEEVNSSYDVSYLYLGFFDEPTNSNKLYTIPRIGTFKLVYAAQKYDEQHPYAAG